MEFENESITEYIDVMLLIFSEMDEKPIDEKKKQRLLNNILPKYIPLLRLRMHKTLQDFINEAIEFGKGYEACERAEQAKTSVEVSAIKDSKTGALRKELEEMKMQIAAIDTKLYSSRNKYDRSRSRSKYNENNSRRTYGKKYDKNDKRSHRNYRERRNRDERKDRKNRDYKKRTSS